ncbi:MAG: AbrB/MazE/SpoVT family DNA-binding domain-containing protein [Ruminococcaceae bacterium]|nr:AbrB/MazE/SpoVT family DNA-binding domain-containing protein [Oscillospiraceae bacterium]
MKTNGIVREMDKLGRIVIPIELRRTLDIAVGDSVEITSQGDKIIVTKYEPNCVFCKGSKNLSAFENKVICSSCLDKIKSI